MVDRPTERALRGRRDVVASPGAVDASSGGQALGQALFGFSRFASQAAEAAGDQLTEEVIAVETQRGREAALEGEMTTLANGEQMPVVSLRPDNSVASRAFNQGVLSVLPNRLETSLLRSLDDLERQQRGNPTAFRNEADAFYDGFRTNIPQELQDDFDLQFERLTTAGVRRQESILAIRETDRARFESGQTVDELISSAGREAFGLVDPNPETRSLAGSNVNDARERLEMLLEQSDPLGDPIYTAAERQAALDRFDVRVLTNSAIGGFQRAIDKESYVNQWITRQREAGDVNLDIVDRVGANLMAELRRHNSLTQAVRRELQQEVDDAITVYSTGRTPAGITGLRQRLTATGENEFLDALDKAERIGGMMLNFRQQGIAAQQEQILELRNIAEPTADQVLLQQAYEKEHAQTIRGLRQDPIGYAMATGVVQEGPVNITSFAIQDLEARARRGRMVQDQFDLQRTPFLRPGEDALMADQLTRMTPSEAIGAANNLAELDQGVLDDVVTAIGDKIPGLDVGLELSVWGETQGSALLYFRGAQALREAPELSVDPSVLERAIQDSDAAEAFASQPAALNSLRKAAEAFYTGLGLDAGSTRTDDATQADRAVRLATGAIPGTGFFGGQTFEGGLLRFNGSVVLPPAGGMEDDEFETMVDNLSNRDLVLYGNGRPAFMDGSALSAEVLSDDMQLESFGPGRYLVKDSAGRYVQTEFGPYVLDLRRAWEDGRNVMPGDSRTLRPTGERTPEGRMLLTDEAGNTVTEMSITIEDPQINDGRPTNIPTIFQGEMVTQEEAIRIIIDNEGLDPDTGRRLEGFDSREEAVEAARERSRELGRLMRDPGRPRSPSGRREFPTRLRGPEPR